MVTRSDKRAFRRIRRWFFVCILLWAIFEAVTYSPAPNAVPDVLLGTWRCEDPQYAGRTFDLSRVSISFGAGDGKVDTGFIRRIETAANGEGMQVTIFYVQDGVDLQCSFVYKSQKEPEIYFRNQPNFRWTKDKES